MIDKNSHYFLLMHPLEHENIIPGIVLTYTVPGSRAKWVECEIVEDKYKIDEGYRIELKSIEEGYGKETFYIKDFISLLNEGFIVKKEPNMQCVEESWNEPLTENVHITHSAYTLKVNNKSR